MCHLGMGVRVRVRGSSGGVDDGPQGCVECIFICGFSIGYREPRRRGTYAVCWRCASFGGGWWGWRVEASPQFLPHLDGRGSLAPGHAGLTKTKRVVQKVNKGYAHALQAESFADNLASTDGVSGAVIGACGGRVWGASGA